MNSRYWPPTVQGVVSVLLVGFFVFYFGHLLGFIPSEGQICAPNEQTGKIVCLTVGIFRVWLWEVGEFLNYYGVALTALATVVMAAFTIIMVRVNERLWHVAIQQTEVSKESLTKIQRAFVCFDSFEPLCFWNDQKEVDYWSFRPDVRLR